MAKSTETSSDSASTATETYLTSPGSTVGTAAYMSPEQVKGQDLDSRTDLFSFGVVLYEMATGTQPFKGNTTGVVFNEILTKVPVSLVRIKPELPDDVVGLIEKALEKDAKLRYQSAKDLLADLRRLKRDSLTGVSIPRYEVETRPKKRLGAALWIGGALVVLAAVAAGIYYWPETDTVVDLPAEPAEIRPITTDGGEKRFPQLSPDGNQILYGARGVSNDWDIYVTQIGEGTATLPVVSSPEAEGWAAWSPDGTQFAFVRDTETKATLYTIPSLGGQPQKVTDVLGKHVSGSFHFVDVNGPISWSPDGKWIAKAEKSPEDGRRRIVLISLQNRDRKPLTDPQATSTLGDYWPSFSPDGTQVAFVRNGGTAMAVNDLWVQSVEGGDPQPVTSEQYFSLDCPTWTHDGREIIFSAATDGGLRHPRLYRISVKGGKPRVVCGVGIGAFCPCVREDRLVYVDLRSEGADIWRVSGPNNPDYKKSGTRNNHPHESDVRRLQSEGVP